MLKKIYKKKCSDSFYILYIKTVVYTYCLKYKRLENNYEPINKSINDMDKFEKRELTKKRTFTKNT